MVLMGSSLPGLELILLWLVSDEKLLRQILPSSVCPPDQIELPKGLEANGMNPWCVARELRAPFVQEAMYYVLSNSPVWLRGGTREHPFRKGHHTVRKKVFYRERTKGGDVYVSLAAEDKAADDGLPIPERAKRLAIDNTFSELLSRLLPVERDILFRRTIDDLKFEEIGEELDVGGADTSQRDAFVDHLFRQPCAIPKERRIELEWCNLNTHTFMTRWFGCIKSRLMSLEIIMKVFDDLPGLDEELLTLALNDCTDEEIAIRMRLDIPPNPTRQDCIDHLFRHHADRLTPPERIAWETMPAAEFVARWRMVLLGLDTNREIGDEGPMELG